jgi:hypothetical protein
MVILIASALIDVSNRVVMASIVLTAVRLGDRVLVDDWTNAETRSSVHERTQISVVALEIPAMNFMIYIMRAPLLD